MYIEPNSTIKILRGIPFDATYEHTLYFATLSAQETYFRGQAKYNLDRQSYQRVQKGWMRVNIQAENLYDCNYLMFQNTAFGTKWFYAFIKSVEYINNTVSQIEFEIDVIQTWHFNYELEECLIDREHSETDDVGDNLVPENLELGEYISDSQASPIDYSVKNTGQTEDLSIVIAATFDNQYMPVGGTFYEQMFSGLYYHIFPNTIAGVASANTFIQNATEDLKKDGIINIFLAPTNFIGANNSAAIHRAFTTPKLTSGAIDGYTPKNKKLYTYPYNFLYVTNLQGNSAIFPYEYFSTSICNFELVGDFITNPTILLYPEYYKGVTTNYDEMLSISGYPQCAYTTDVYKAWTAQISSYLPFNAVGSGVGIVGGAAGSVAASGAAITVGTVASAALLPLTVAAVSAAAYLLGQANYHSLQPPQAHGTQSATALCAARLLDFQFHHKHIRGEFARIIDNYFTMYGYACHKVKVPNRNARPHWNFTKTSGCQIKGRTINGVTHSIPNDDAIKICGIYDKGITFWKNASEVGQYAQHDNSPVT